MEICAFVVSIEPVTLSVMALPVMIPFMNLSEPIRMPHFWFLVPAACASVILLFAIEILLHVPVEDAASSIPL